MIRIWRRILAFVLIIGIMSTNMPTAWAAEAVSDAEQSTSSEFNDYEADVKITLQKENVGNDINISEMEQPSDAEQNKITEKNQTSDTNESIDENEGIPINENAIANTTDLIIDDSDTMSEEFEFIKNEDETLTITGYIGTKENIIIPGTIGNMKVKSIGDYAFSEDNKIVSVQISPGITQIGMYAFYWCQQLTEVILGPDIQSIGKGAFSLCSQIKELTLPNALSEYSTPIFNNGALKTIHIPSTVMEIPVYFQQIASLQNIEVEEGNLKYSSQDGVLFNTDKSLLIQYPKAREENIYIVPESVTTIGVKGFEAAKLSNISLPFGLLNIEERAFAYSNLSSVVFPHTVKCVANNAFKFCTNLTEITLPDSPEEMAAAFDDTDIQRIRIPKSVTKIDLMKWMPNLHEIIVEDGNSVYTSKDGILYDQSVQTLIWYPAQKKEDTYVLPDSVQRIEASCFSGCDYLVNVRLPDSLNEIGDYAFYDMVNLIEICIPNAVTKIGEFSFSDCKSLTAVVLGSNTNVIGDYAFSYCSNLEEITIPTALEEIGEKTFVDCQIKKVHIPQMTTDVGGNIILNLPTLQEFDVDIDNTVYSSQDGILFDKNKTMLIRFPRSNQIMDYHVPDSVETISEFGFESANYLEHITLSDKMTKIESGTFAKCSKLESIVFGRKITKIGSYAFRLCENLKSLTIPDCVKEIEQDVFANTGVENLIISASVTYIHPVLYGLPTLQKIDVDPNNLNYSSLEGILYNYEKTSLICYPTKKAVEEYEVPNSVEIIENKAFYNNDYLTKITLPEGLIKISDYAFYDTDQLDNLKIPDSVEYIGEYAFFSCDHLVSLLFGHDLRAIGREAFGCCLNLREITLPSALSRETDAPFSGSGIERVNISVDAGLLYISLADFQFLKEIRVEEGNKFYSSQDGVLFDNSKTKLVCYPKARESEDYKIPDTVKEISDKSFYDCDNLVNIVIPESVEYIKNRAFQDCGRLLSVIIPSSVTKIDDYAFAECYALKEFRVTAHTAELGKAIFEADNDVVIYCEKDSPMHRYAEYNGLAYILSTYRILYTLSKQYVVSEGEEAFVYRDVLDNYIVTLVNKTTGKHLSDIKFNSVAITISDTEVKYLDEIEIVLESKKNETVIYKSTVVLDETLGASLDIITVQKGIIRTNTNASEKQCVFIYDVNGQLVETVEGTGQSFESGRLNAGEYSLIYIRGNSYFWKYNTLDGFENAGLKQDDHYAIRSVIVMDGKISETDVVTVPNIDGDMIRFLESASTSYTISSDKSSIDGLLNLRVHYRFQGSKFEYISDMTANLEIPSGTKYIANSLTINGKPIEKVSETQNNQLLLELKDMEGTICFSVRAVESTWIYSNAFISFRYEGNTIKELIGTVEAEIAYITIEGPSRADNKSIWVNGITVPNTKVEIFDKEHKIGEASSSASGKWKAFVPLFDVFEESVHQLTAKIKAEDGETKISELLEVFYNSGNIAVEKIKMYHNSQKFEISSKTLYEAQPVVSFRPGAPFTFEIKLLGSEMVKKLLLSSTRGNEEKKMEAFYDKAKDIWIASGFFDEGDHSYVPGPISVYYTTKANLNWKKQTFTIPLQESYNNLSMAAANAEIINYKSSFEIPDDFSPFESSSADLSEINDGYLAANIMLDNSQRTQIEVGLEKTTESVDVATAVKQAIKEGYVKVDNPTLYSARSVQSENYIKIDLNSEGSAQIIWKSFGKNLVETATLNIAFEVAGLGDFANVLGIANDYMEVKGQFVKMDAIKAELLKSDLPKEEVQRRVQAIEQMKDRYYMYKSIKILGTMICMGVGISNPLFGFFAGIVYEAAMKTMDDCVDESLDLFMEMVQERESAKDASVMALNFCYIIDPSGFVYEAVESNRLEGVNVTAYHKNDHGESILWNSEEFGQKNPLTTDHNGYYAWDVPEGEWRISCEKEGYTAVYSDWLMVPPPRTNVNISLVSEKTPELLWSNLYDEYVELKFDQYMKVLSLDEESINVRDSKGLELSGQIVALDKERTPEGEWVARTFRYCFTEPMKDQKCSLSVGKEVQNYVGQSSKQVAIQNLLRKFEYKRLECASEIECTYNTITTVPVQIIPTPEPESNNINMFCKVGESDFVSIEQIGNFDSNGVAKVQLKGLLPGETDLQFTIPESNVKISTKVNVLLNSATREVSSLEMFSLPMKTIFRQGDDFDCTGAQLNINYTDGTSEHIEVSNDMCQGFNSNVTGEQTIFVSYGGRKTTFKIRVDKYKPLVSIILSNTNMELKRGDVQQLSVDYLPTDTTDDKNITWISSNTQIIKVDQKGRIIAVNDGTAKITAKVGEHTAICEITVNGSVNVPTASIKNNSIVKKGASVKLSCSTPGAVIYYTVDGGKPTRKSIRYTSAIQINSDITIKAIAVKDRYVDSVVSTFHYQVEPQTQNEKIEAFVTRLYQKILLRTPDLEGMKYQTNRLITRQDSGAGLARGFIDSNEFKNRNLNDNDYLEVLYSAFLDRKPDNSGKEYYLDMLSNGVSRQFVYKGFAESPEFDQICSDYGIERGTVILNESRDQNPKLTMFVYRLYDKALGRKAEIAGLNYYCQEIKGRRVTPVQAAQNFIFSQEFINKKLDDAEYVKVLYRTFMGREYDQNGLSYHLERIKSGVTREDILFGFAYSPEFKNIIAGFGL